MKKDFKILFVCMANICRSPAAEGILKHMLNQYPHLHLSVESCGLGDWHVGQGPDWRMKEAASMRGINLTGTAKQFQKAYLDQFDLILAADHEILQYLYQYALTPEHKAKIFLMTIYSPNYQGQDVPDPYLGGTGQFDLVMDILEDACQGLLYQLQKS